MFYGKEWCYDSCDLNMLSRKSRRLAANLCAGAAQQHCGNLSVLTTQFKTTTTTTTQQGTSTNKNCSAVTTYLVPLSLRLYKGVDTNSAAPSLLFGPPPKATSQQVLLRVVVVLVPLS